MNTLRFGFLTVALFALAFIGISWASKGFPVMAMRSEAPKPQVRVAPSHAEPARPDAARIPTFEQSVKEGLRKDWENSKTAQSDGDKARDKLRLELWQAAIGYNLSPCDATMKKNLVEALGRYTSAWAEMAGCRSGGCSGDDKRLDAAAAAFKTPADLRVHQTLREAIEKGGIAREDFPKAIRNNVLMFTGMPFDAPQGVCTAGRRANSLR